jgi:hypothetical protein
VPFAAAEPCSSVRYLSRSGTLMSAIEIRACSIGQLVHALGDGSAVARHNTSPKTKRPRSLANLFRPFRSDSTELAEVLALPSLRSPVPTSSRSISLVSKVVGFSSYKNKSGDMREPSQPLLR